MNRLMPCSACRIILRPHLYEVITLADLASVSLYSPWYSYRLFSKWVNLTPADYIRRLRLSKSALKLRGCAVHDHRNRLCVGV